MSIRTLDDRDPSIVYSTGWAQAGLSLEYNSTTTWTALVGLTARVSFRGTAVGVFGTITAKDKDSVAPESLYSIDGGLPVRFAAAQAPRPQYSQRFFLSPVLPEADHVLTITNAGVGALFLDFVMVQSNEDTPPASSLTPSLSSSSSVPLSTSTSTITTPPPPVTVTITSVQAVSTLTTGVANNAKASSTAVAVSGASKSNAGAVAGGIIAGIVVLFLAVFGFIMWRRKRARRQSLLKSSSGIVWARPEIDTPPASRVHLDTPPPPAAPVMSQHNGGQYSSDNYYPGGYASSNSYNNYQQQHQQRPPQYQQPQYQQHPAHSTYDYSSSVEHDASGGITQSPQPYPQQGYIPPSQLLKAGVGNDYSSYHRGGVPS